jgi:hypothetical protein
MKYCPNHCRESDINSLGACTESHEIMYRSTYNKYCIQCGTELKELKCNGCHKEINLTDSFCSYCGLKTNLYKI